MIWGIIANGNGDFPVTFPQRILQLLHRGQAAGQPIELPVPNQSRKYSLQIAFRQVDIGWRYLDEAGLYDRVDFDVVGFIRFTDNLPVYLAACRYVDRDVTLDLRMAAESSTPIGTVAGQESLLDLTWRRQIFCTGYNAVFRQLSLSYVDLAAPAHRAASTDGVDIDTQAARRLQHGRPY